MKFQLLNSKNYKVKRTIKLLEQAARIFDIKLYFTGGIIRDAFMNRPNSDIDLFIEEFNLSFIHYLEIIFQTEFKIIYEFQNASATLNNGVSIDVSIIRKDFYSFPGALPLVTKGTFLENIYRRDFSINSIVYSGNKIIDPSKGIRDIKKREIKSLYYNSFLDDPTRILRGIKFSLRYNYDFEEDTKFLIINSFLCNSLVPISFVRFYRELFGIFSEKNISNFFKSKIYSEISPLLLGEFNRNKLYDFSLFIKKNRNLIKKLKITQEEIFELYISLINYFRLKHNFSSLIIEKNFFKQRDSFYFSETFLNFINEKSLIRLTKKDKNLNSNIFNSLKVFSNKEVFALIFLLNNNLHCKNIIKKYIKIREIKPLISGRVLINMNFSPREQFKKVIEKAFLCQIDNPKYLISDILNEVLPNYGLSC